MPQRGEALAEGTASSLGVLSRPVDTFELPRYDGARSKVYFRQARRGKLSRPHVVVALRWSCSEKMNGSSVKGQVVVALSTPPRRVMITAFARRASCRGVSTSCPRLKTRDAYIPALFLPTCLTTTNEGLFDTMRLDPSVQQCQSLANIPAPPASSS